jgi:hypothetical protein
MEATFALEQAARNRELSDGQKGLAQALLEEMGKYTCRGATDAQRGQDAS